MELSEGGAYLRIDFQAAGQPSLAARLVLCPPPTLKLTMGEIKKKIRLKFYRFHCLDRFHCAFQYQQLNDNIIDRFEASHPEVEIESEILRNWYQFIYKLSKNLSAGDAPDVFHVNGGGILKAYVDSGYIYDLTEDLDNSDWGDTFIPSTLAPLKFQDKNFAVPLEQGAVFMWYNKQIFNQFGFSIPQTFDDLIDICRILREAGIVPISLGNRERWPGDFLFSHLLHRIGGDEVFVDDFTQANDYSLVRSSFIQAGIRIQQLVDIGAFPEGFNMMDYPQQRLLYAQGKAAMQLMGNRLIDYLKLEGPDVLDQSDYFLFPSIDQGKGKLSTLFGGSLATFAVSEHCQNREAAVSFLKALTDESAARDVVFEMGDIPALKYISKEDFPSPIQANMAEELNKAEKIQVHYFKSLPPKLSGVYLNSIYQLLARTITPEQAFKDIENATGDVKYNSLI